MGTSDIHGLTDWKHEISQGGHRPMTFVNVENKTPEALKKSLFEGKTVIWFKDLLVGKEMHLKALVSENITINSLVYPVDKTIASVEMSNHGAVPIQLEYLGEYTFHKRPIIFSIPAKTTLLLQVKTVIKKKEIKLPFRVLNAIIAPKKYLELSFVAK